VLYDNFAHQILFGFAIRAIVGARDRVRAFSTQNYILCTAIDFGLQHSDCLLFIMATLQTSRLNGTGEDDAIVVMLFH
jgi:hypothetical protein